LPLSQPYNTSPWNYNGSESVSAIPNNNVADWILIELRETPGDVTTATPATLIERQVAFILKTGEIVGLDGSSQLIFNISISENLYAVIWHRNHIPVISSVPLIESGGIYSYDFSYPADQAHSNGSQNEIASNIWGLIGGDANSSANVSSEDKTLEWENTVGNSDYIPSDLNLDGQIDNKDKDEFWLPNLGKGTFVPN